MLLLQSAGIFISYFLASIRRDAFSLTELNLSLNGLNQCSTGHVWVQGDLSSEYVDGRERGVSLVLRSVPWTSTRSNRASPCHGKGRGGWNQFSLSSSTSRPTLNPVISVCFPRVAFASADVSIIETSVYKTFKTNINFVAWRASYAMLHYRQLSLWIRIESK